MKSLVAILCLVAGKSLATDLVCTLTDEACVANCAQTQVTFAIDFNQFVAPQNPNDPPRRQVTRVTVDADTFMAEAIAMDGGVLGFDHNDGSGGATLMIVQPDGTTRLSRQPQGRILTGLCTRS